MKYRIELTDVQLNAVLRAVNLMLRTGTGQMDELTEWLVTQGDNINLDTRTDEGQRVFEDYYITRAAIRPVIDGSIYKFAPGDGYKGEEWDCEDLRPEMWDIDASSGVYELAELPCYYMGEEYDAEGFFKYHDILKPMLLRDFKKKFPNIVVMDECISNVYLENGTILLCGDWNGECYCSDGKRYHPVTVPISYYCDDDGSNEPDQYEPVGYIEENT